jgi:predicted Ser/Thr protein kinase
MARLSRALLESSPLESLHRARNWTKADVSALEWPPDSGRSVVVKDLKRTPLAFRVLAGRPLLRREARALRALSGVEGVPKLVASIGADAIAMERSPGTPLKSWEPGSVPPQVLAALSKLLGDIHARGVTHGDLHADNILLEQRAGGAFEIALIDWATACVFGRGAASAKSRARAWSFGEWRALDERALAKLKRAHAPEELTTREVDLLENGGSCAYRAVKRGRRALHSVLRALRSRQK